MSVQEMIQQAENLSLEERAQLIKALVDMVIPPAEEQHELIELAGLGAEIWEGIDAQEYVNQLRREWDNRP